MSEYNYLTGRKDLFDGAPPEAMVVLETNDGQIYYAVSHNRGAKYWYEHGTPGRPIGLIALFEKTRVVASRVLVGGLPKEEPKRDPIPKSRQTRLDRMQQAQSSLKKAVSQPFPVNPRKLTPKKPEQEVVFQGDTAKCEKCGVRGIHACMGAPAVYTEQDKQRLNEAVKQIVADEQKPKVEQGGFVSLFALAEELETRLAPAFISVQANGNVSVSTKIAKPGEMVDIQADVARGLIRIGRVSSGGKALTTGRQFTARAVTKLFKIPQGQKHIRIELTEDNGWFVGQAELVPEVRK